MMAFTVFVMICSFFAVFTAKAEELPGEAPGFSACIEYSSQGYIVKGTFTEFPPDIRSAEVLYSLDGETYQISGEEWNITNWSDGSWTEWEEDTLEKFQNQTCLHFNTEPLKSYLSGTLNRFYVKLRLTRENGMTYDTQAAVIDRGNLRPVPEEMTPIAGFAPSICVRTFRPFSYYGRYEITVCEDSTQEEILSFLPDTLPVRISLQKGITHVADGIVDCPVTWKPLTDLALTPGESVIIADAAEEIVVPEGMTLNTPLGDFQLNESLGIDQDGMNDEVRLVLNVIEKDSDPAGVLSCDFNGLSMAFRQKPTGATSIRAYTLTEGETEWTELVSLPLLAAVNAQPSTASSGYTYLLDNTHELYRSYMAACNEGREPAPFFVGLKIEGGVYNGKELILPWPDTYDLPLELPKLGGSGGNEDNAGADNKGDATDEGQRPNLPQDTGENDGGQQTEPPQNTGGNGSGQLTKPSQNAQNVQENSGSNVPPLENSVLPKQQNKRNSNIADSGYQTAPQPLTASQAAAGTITEKSSPTPSSNAETEARSKNTTQTPGSETGSESGSTASSAKAKSPLLLFIVFIFIIAALGISGLCVAASARKRTANTGTPNNN